MTKKLPVAFLAHLVLATLLGMLLGLGLFTFWYARGASYFSNDPTACVNCHIMREQYDSWQHSSHHAVASCVDCHLPHEFPDKYLAKAENGFFHSAAFTLQNYPEPIHVSPKNARVLNHSCLHCHKELVHDLLHLGSLRDEAGSCVRCHPSVGHGSPW